MAVEDGRQPWVQEREGRRGGLHVERKAYPPFAFYGARAR